MEREQAIRDPKVTEITTRIEYAEAVLGRPLTTEEVREIRDAIDEKFDDGGIAG